MKPFEAIVRVLTVYIAIMAAIVALIYLAHLAPAGRADYQADNQKAYQAGYTAGQLSVIPCVIDDPEAEHLKAREKRAKELGGEG